MLDVFDKKCLICGQIVDERAHFWKLHKISEKNYYETHFPRKDVFSGQTIQFKSFESYCLSEFTDRESLKNFCAAASRKEVLDYIARYLRGRKELKAIEYFPGAFESKTLQIPSLQYLIKKFGVNIAYDISKNCGLLVKFDYSKTPIFKNWSINTLIVDTRESRPLIPDSFILRKLDFGDYCLDIPNPRVFVERKSLMDLYGVLCGGFERFCKELDRAKAANAYVVILVEEKLQIFISGKMSYAKNLKASKDFLFHQCREIIKNYPNTQFLFVDGRKEAVRLLPKILKIDNIEELDLQYLYEKAVL